MATSRPVSKALIIAHMVNRYLGPKFPKATTQGATLNSLRARLQTNELTDEPATKLAWDVHEAIRTECFKVPYPNPPPPALLQLITNTDVVLTGIPAGPLRPNFAPGCRVSVPGENGAPRRPGTSLELRQKVVKGSSVPPVLEALVHLDGEGGGSFRWVQTSALIPWLADPVQTPTATKGRKATAKASAAGGTRAAPATTNVTLVAPTAAALPPPATSAVVTAGVAQQQQLVGGNQQAPTQAGSVQPVPSQPASLAQAASAQAASAQASVAQASSEQATAEQAASAVSVPSKPRQPQKGVAQKNYTAAQLKAFQQRQVSYQQALAAELARERTEELLQRGALPSAFFPEELRSCSPPPRKRLRRNVPPGPVSFASGSVESAAVSLRKPLSVSVVRSETQAPALVSQAYSASSAQVVTPEGSRPSQSPPGGGVSTGRTGPFRATLRMPSRSADAVREKIMVVERLVARRENAEAGGVVEYFTKWRGVGWDGCSWESRSALLQDVPGLVVDFDGRHPTPPAVVRGVAREPAAAERESHERLISERKAKATADAERAEEQRRLDAEPVLIPYWFETPFFELTFAGGMVLHCRRNEGVVFNDGPSAGRDMKNRRFRFREEFPEEAQRLFPAARAEAALNQRTDTKALIDATVRARKMQGSRPIQFPRGLGSCTPNGVADPVRRADIDAAPPSWESYLFSLGLECVDWEREHLPDMPTAPRSVVRSMEHARGAMEAEERERERERKRRMVAPTDAQTCLTKASSPPRAPQKGFYEEDILGPVPVFAAVKEMNELDNEVQRRLAEGPEGGVEGRSLVSKKIKKEGEPSSDLLRARNKLFGSAVTSRATEGIEGGTVRKQFYDSVFNCWRVAPTAE